MKYKEVFVFWIRIILGFPDSNPKRSKIKISEIGIRSRFYDTDPRFWIYINNQNSMDPKRCTRSGDRTIGLDQCPLDRTIGLD